MSDSDLEQLEKELDSFMEWATDDKSLVTRTSCILFARHIQRKAIKERDAALVELAEFKAAAALIPLVWSKSLSSCWPADESEPDENWVVGTISDEGEKYPVIEVDAYQYDAHGHSEKIAKAIVALWCAAQKVKP